VRAMTPGAMQEELAAILLESSNWIPPQAIRVLRSKRSCRRWSADRGRDHQQQPPNVRAQGDLLASLRFGAPGVVRNLQLFSAVIQVLPAVEEDPPRQSCGAALLLMETPDDYGSGHPSMKNFLFLGKRPRWRELAGIYSLVATCKANGVNPFAYLADVIICIPQPPNSCIDECSRRTGAGTPDESDLRDSLS